MQRTDYAILALACLVLFGFALIDNRVLTGHESVLPESAREMMADHDWLIPKIGGTPWLERPPLPDWIMVGIAELFGRCDREWIVRIAPALMATVVVFLTAWMAAGWFGRATGVLSGLILATMWEFFTFATDPESDIFLCAIVTGALAVFVKLEFFHKTPANGENISLFGSRPWPVLAFFVLLGMTNLAKGLIFGTVMVGIPVAGFLLWNGAGKAIRRYVWLWGWLAFAGVALAWPIAVCQRYPGALDLWLSDYVGRWRQSPFHEPPWYYFQELLLVTMPWPVAAIIGLWLTGAKALRQRNSAERFLWCWGVLTPLVFSIPDGKHHHYLLQCLAPWAILASLGAVRLWQAIAHWPAWLRNPALSVLTFGLPGDLVLAALSSKVPGPCWQVPALMVAWPALTFAVCWAVAQRNGRLALAGVVLPVTAVYCLGYAYQTRYFDSYRADSAFLKKAQAMAPPYRPLFVTFDSLYPLETFHLLFYCRPGVTLLHNPTFLLDDRIRDKEIYVIARYHERAALTRYGSAEVILQSNHTRSERSPADRRTLFLLRFKEGLERTFADVKFTPMQVTHRERGPFLPWHLSPPRWQGRHALSGPEQPRRSCPGQ